MRTAPAVMRAGIRAGAGAGRPRRPSLATPELALAWADALALAPAAARRWRMRRRWPRRSESPSDGCRRREQVRPLGSDREVVAESSETSASVMPCWTSTALTWAVVTFGILELDLPLGAARVVDRELQANLAVGERRQEDEDQARDGDERREEEEPAPLADDVKHDRGPLRRATGRPIGASQELLVGDADTARPCWAPSWRTTSAQDRARDTVTAVNMDVSTPMIRTSAKPWIVDEPNQVQDAGGDQARHVRVEDRVPGSVEARLDGRRQASCRRAAPPWSARRSGCWRRPPCPPRARSPRCRPASG